MFQPWRKNQENVGYLSICKLCSRRRGRGGVEGRRGKSRGNNSHTILFTFPSILLNDTQKSWAILALATNGLLVIHMGLKIKTCKGCPQASQVARRPCRFCTEFVPLPTLLPSPPTPLPTLSLLLAPLPSGPHRFSKKR